jgi:ribosome-binding protein aMBF1 (putative translation factor)
MMRRIANELSENGGISDDNTNVRRRRGDYSPLRAEDNETHSCTTKTVKLNNRRFVKRHNKKTKEEINEMGEDYGRRIAEAREELANMAQGGNDGCDNIGRIENTLEKIENYKDEMECLRDELGEKLCDARKRCTMLDVCKSRAEFKRLEKERNDMKEQLQKEIEGMREQEHSKINECQVLAMKNLDKDCKDEDDATICSVQSMNSKFCEKTKEVNKVFKLRMVDDQSLIKNSHYSSMGEDSRVEDADLVWVTKPVKGDQCTDEWINVEKFWCASATMNCSIDSIREYFDICTQWTKFRCEIDANLQEAGWEIMRKVTGRCDIGNDSDISSKDEEDMSLSEWMESHVIRELQKNTSWWKERGDKTYADQYGFWNHKNSAYEKTDSAVHDMGAEVPKEKRGDGNCATYADPGASLHDAISVWCESLESAVDFDSFNCVNNSNSNEDKSDWFCSGN